MLSVDPGQHEVNGIRSGRCPACKRELTEHLPSGRRPRPESGRIDVVLGRCRPGGVPAAQKLSWLAMSEPLTEAEYRERYTDRPPPLEPCPGCGGQLKHHGRYWRGLGESQSARVNPLPIYRGVCKDKTCPVVTVTHYPCFVVPYKIVPAARREAAVRGRAEDGRSWAKLSEEVGYSPATVRRWVAEVDSSVRMMV